MLHTLFVYLDLKDPAKETNPNDPDSGVIFRRVCPLGSINTNTDVVSEILERFGLLPEAFAECTRLAAYAKEAPTITPHVEALDTVHTNGDRTLSIIANIGPKGETFVVGKIVKGRDSAMEYEMRRVANVIFRDQLDELLRIQQVHPELQIGHRSVFVSDRGSAVLS